MADLVDLPEEVSEALAACEESNAERMAALCTAIALKRKDAIDARKNSGIEDVWLKAEEAYLGIDDTNRGSFAGAKWAKPATMAGGLTAQVTSTEVTSDAFVRLTSRYVDAGAAKLGEILLPAGEKAFSFTSTPVPEMISKLKDTSQAIVNGVALERDAPQQQAIPGTPAPQTQAIPGIPITVKDLAEEAIERAQAAAKKAETRISDWMVESRYRGENRKVIFDAARIGVGVLKGPFPRAKTSRALDGGAVKIITRIVPTYEWRDPWNIYPEGTCGENIRNGSYLFDMDPFSRKQLQDLKKDPTYNPKAIDKVLTEGPTAGATEDKKPGSEKSNKDRFHVWYFYGTLTREDMLLAGGLKPDEESADEVYAIVTMVNDTIIRASMNPLDSGEIPYHAVPWQRRAEHWAGVGVGEQIEMPQKAINAAIRALFNNAGKSAGSTIVLDRGAITPADKSWVLTPDKIFYKAADATSDDVRKAFAFFQVPNMGPQLMAIIELCLRLAEESTNIPLVTQGQSGPTSPETFGATQLQNNNANQLLRSIGYAFDDYITEPVVLQSYEYLLLDPDVPEDEKGDWTIDAHGSVAMIERAIEEQTIAQMGQFAINPVFGVNPKLWFAEFSRTKHLDPRTFQYTPEEQAKIDAQPKPAAPAIEVAKIRSADAERALVAEQQLAAAQAQAQQALEQIRGEAKLQIAEMKKVVDEMRIRRDTDRDTVYVQAETQRTQNEYDARMRELETKREIALLDYANKNELKLADVKKDLAKTEMTLQVQRELSELGAKVAIRKHDTPDVQPAEPVGKAPDGEAFTK